MDITVCINMCLKMGKRSANILHCLIKESCKMRLFKKELRSSTQQQKNPLKVFPPVSVCVSLQAPCTSQLIIYTHMKNCEATETRYQRQ